MILYLLAGAIGFGIVWAAVDLALALRLKPIPHLPEERLDPFGLSAAYCFLTEPEKAPAGLVIDEAYLLDSLAPSIEYINRRYDCADFRMQLLFRLYKDCRDQLPWSVRELIKRTCLNFKYWMDEPGEDSMCYWSENHQLLFAVSEYLAGQEWPEERFPNSGMTGAEHMKKALPRIHAWMAQRFQYGFSEWLSNNYYAEDMAPMANYIQYSRDKDSVERMKIIFDLLWFDVATHAVNNTFVAASSRMYSDNKSGNMYGNRIRAAMETVWPGVESSQPVYPRTPLERQIADCDADLDTAVRLAGVDVQMMQNFIAAWRAGCYRLPEVIRDIALDREPAVIKSSSGLNVKELPDERLVGQSVNQIMAQMGGEAFTNPEVIENTLKYLVRNRMLKNQFVNSFRFINIKLLRLLRIPRLASAAFQPMTNGIALERGNIYCYRTKYYTLTTAAAMSVGSCGDQEHIWSANIAPDLAVYTTHPARDDDSEEKHGASPGYWVGNGRRPMSVQEKNINITIYKLPRRKRLLEPHIARITHAYMPKEKFDELELEGSHLFARRGKVLLGLIANGEIKYRTYDPYAAALLVQHDNQLTKIDGLQLQQEFDLVREGESHHVYITELSDTDSETYGEFKRRILTNEVDITGGGVRYRSSGRELYVHYSGIFRVNGEARDMEYRRYDSRYSVTERKADTIVIRHNRRALRLNFNRIERTETLN